MPLHGDLPDGKEAHRFLERVIAMTAQSYLPRRFLRLTMTLLAVACLAVWSVALLPVPAEAGTRLEIPAWSFDRGNARVQENADIYADYRDRHPNLIVTGSDTLPWTAEYDIELPLDASCTLSICYASAEARPVELWLDHRKVATCCRGITGNAAPYPDRFHGNDRPRPLKNFHGLRWEEACKLPISKGRHTLKLTRRGTPPRVSALRLDSAVTFPGDWKPVGPAVIANERGIPRYRGRHRYNLAFGQANPKMKLDRIPPRYRSFFLPPGSVNVATLGMAIEDVITEFGAQFPKGPQYLKQLAELEKRQRAAQGGTPEQIQKAEDALASLRRQAMLDHPLLKFDKLLFVKRMTNAPGHIYEDHRAGRTMGGNLCILSPVTPNGRVTEIAPQLAGGIFGRFDLSFDARRVVFAYRRSPETNYRIYEIGIDGKGLRQLTFARSDEPKVVECYKGGRLAGGYDDIDPCYLPNGKIMFASTRTQRVVFCLGTSVTTLHVMDGDGKNLHSISEGPITEVDPCVMDDGRVVYMRWEYVDKGFGNVQSLWSMRPDGSSSAHVYKNNVVLPGGMVDARSIPGSRKIVATAVAHCGMSVGSVVVLDTRLTRRTAKAMTNITREIALPGMFLHPTSRKFGSYKEPYAFSEKLFVVAHNPHENYTEPKGYGLYVLDAWGNRTELYRDVETSCFQPIPLRPRRIPTEIPAVAAPNKKGGAIERIVQADKMKEKNLATLSMQDVYQGMTGIERGRVKYLRVMEALALTWEEAWRGRKQGDASDLQASTVSHGGDVHLKKVHGIVPVHEDGSAYFTVPAQKNLYFQALDENYMELQRMRTFVNMMPGEQRSCIGCHELRRDTPGAVQRFPLALKQKPAALSPQPGEAGPYMVHYPRDIQPILQRRCVNCHSGEKPQGELDLSGELTQLYCRSYENLLNKELVSFLHGCYGEANVPAEPPLTFGSHRSKLVERIRRQPCKAKLTREEFIQIVTWIDANAPYYGTHQGKKNIRWKEEKDFRPMPLAGK